jgi:hypothetical protein
MPFMETKISLHVAGIPGVSLIYIPSDVIYGRNRKDVTTLEVNESINPMYIKSRNYMAKICSTAV